MKFITFLLLTTFTISTYAFPSEFDTKDISYLYPENNGRIVGGVPTDIETINYIVSLHRHGSHSCGACIISEIHLLTAAHCVTGNAPASLRIRAGSSYHGRDGHLTNVSNILIHPSYVPSTIDFDYAILTLDSPLEFNEGIQPISLPRKDQTIADGTLTWTSGWGRTMHPDEPNDRLRKVLLPIVNRIRCREAYASRNHVTEQMICAGDYYYGGIDACQGDSGGPLAYYDSNGRRYLFGITSWGLGCARPGFPGVWAYVPPVLQWIHDNTNVPPTI